MQKPSYEELELEIDRLKKEIARLQFSESPTNNPPAGLTISFGPQFANPGSDNYQTIFNIIDELLFVLDFQGNIIYANNNVFRRLGYKTEELIGKPVLLVHPRQNHDEAAKIFDDIIAGITDFCNIPFVTRNGEIIPVETRVSFGTWNNSPALLGVTKDLSKEKKAEWQLRESEEKYRKMVSILPDGVIIHQNGKIVYANPAADKIMKANKTGDLLGMSAINFVHPDFRELAMERIKNSLTNKNAAHTIEEVFLGFDGQPIQVLVTAFPFQYEDKPAMLTVFTDISSLKEAEKELIIAKEKVEESEQIHKEIFNSTTDAFFIHDINTGAILDVNNTMLEMYGYTKEEVLKLHIEDISATEMGYTQDKALEKKDEALKKGYSRFEWLSKRKDGTLFWDEVTLKRVMLFNKERILAVARNINQRKHAEAELQKSQAIFSLFMKHSPIYIYIKQILDNRSVVLQASDNFTDMIGIHGYDMIGKNMYELFPPEFAKKITDDDIDVVTKGEVKSLIEELHGRYYNTIKFPITMGQWTYLAGYTIDITNIKQTEEELIRAKEKAEESDRLKTAFLQNMSHEIRTPMNAIMGFSELLNENFNDKEKLELFASIICQRSNDLLEIINDILDISKIESGQLTLNPETCNINELFLELELFFTEHKKRMGKENVILKKNLPLCPDILMDKIKLKQILINLLSNAFKFTEYGHVEYGCNITGHELVFYVTDTGIGIPPDKHTMIFERFAQIRQGINSNIGGTGLGLAIVKGLLGLMNGRIWVESEPMRGSTFFFSFKCEQAKNVNNNQKKSHESFAGQFSDKTILIVEDDSFNAQYLKEILLKTGINIHTADKGKTAIDLAITTPVDLILMDIRLPDLTGYEITKIIKELKPNIKIIAQTAYAAHDERQKALIAGCDDYISKPTKKNDLLKMVNKYLGT